MVARADKETSAPGTFETCRPMQPMSVRRGRSEVTGARSSGAIDLTRASRGLLTATAKGKLPLPLKIVLHLRCICVAAG
jgi:hypothetical protein